MHDLMPVTLMQLLVSSNGQLAFADLPESKSLRWLQESFVICVILSLVLSTGAMGAIFAYARHHQLLLIPSAP